MAHHIFIQGPLGSGKTFVMSYLAHHWKYKTEARGGTCQLFSNYELKDSIAMDHYEDWYKVAAAQGGIVCWDESQMAFNNRAWGTYGQTLITETLMFTRKMKALTLYCSPSINNVDSRIRQLVEILVTCKHIAGKGFSLHFRDYQTGEFMMTQFIPEFKAKRIFKLGLYDTDNMVKACPLPKNEVQGREFMETLHDIHDKARGKKRVFA